MAHTGRRSSGWALLPLLGWLLVAAGVAVVLAVAGWLVYTNLQRDGREQHTVEQLAQRFVDAQATEGRFRWLATDDVSLYLRSWGDPQRPTLLLVHGTGAWSGTWFGLPATLAAAGWHVVAVDLPPFGLTRAETSMRVLDFSRAAQAARLLAVVRDAMAASGRPVVLVGHSFGAGPALEAALVAPRGVLRQLVLIDAALGLGADGAPPVCTPVSGLEQALQMRTLRTALLGATVTVPAFTPALLRRFVHRQAVVTETLVTPYRVPFQREDFTATLGDWAMAFARSACEPAASLSPAALTRWSQQGRLPVALLWGDRDSVTPLAQAHALARWLPTAKLTVLPGLGHIPHIEDPAALAAALQAAVGRP